MSEAQVSVAPQGPTAGMLLRQAREAAGLHVSTLAANLKVPVQKLEALEADRYEELPDAVFVRALASSVCRTLKIDPAPVLGRLPQTQQPRLAQRSDSINAPFRSPNDPAPPGFLNQVSRPVLFTVAALLLGALVVVFWPLVQDAYEAVVQANQSAPAPSAVGRATTDPAAPATAPAASATAAAPTPVTAPATAATNAPAAPAPTVVAQAAQTPAAPVANAPASAAVANGMQLRTSSSASAAPVAAAPAAGSSAPAPAAAASAATPAGLVVFRARAQSWVQVKDASGATVMQRLLEPGETASASGALPLRVVVGSAQSTEVQVRGRPLDLAPLVRDNVARFEVK